jgi:Protein of unknown function (DUF2971)
MRLFHFLNTDFALKDIRERRLKISRIDELNDPFEFLGVDTSNREYRDALNKTKSEISKNKGLLCFSKNWNNPVLWGHYADKHRGICLGFDMPDDLPRQVSYVNSRFNWPTEIDQSFMTQLLFTKFSHWSYEDEYRVYVKLEDRDGDFYYFDFCEELVLKQVIVGPSSSASRSDVQTALGDLSPNIEVFKARAAFKSFSVVKNKNSRLWA